MATIYKGSFQRQVLKISQSDDRNPDSLISNKYYTYQRCEVDPLETGWDEIDERFTK